MSNKQNDIYNENRLENAQLVSDNLIIFQDYSVAVHCSNCKKMEEYTKDSKQANLLNQYHDKAQNWICRECYKLGKEEFTPPNPQDVIQERIGYAQSWNLAVQVCSHWVTSDKTKANIEEWQKYFYDKLTNRQKHE